MWQARTPSRSPAVPLLCIQSFSQRLTDFRAALALHDYELLGYCRESPPRSEAVSRGTLRATHGRCELERRFYLTARLRTLGCVELNDADGKQILQVLRQPKRLALLTYLVLARPYGFQRRDRLLLQFWPDSDEERARAALRKSTYRLRQALGADVIQSRGDSELAVDPDLLHCDVREFDAALADGRPADALALYGGDLLDGFHLDGASPDFERWLDEQRSRLKKDAAQAAWDVSAEREQVGDMRAAVKMARRAFELAPPDGQRLRHLLEILDRAGDRAGALQAYDKFSSWLADEYGAEPPPETVQLVEQIRSRSEAGAAVLQVPEPGPGASLESGSETPRTQSAGSRWSNPAGSARTSRSSSGPVCWTPSIGIPRLSRSSSRDTSTTGPSYPASSG